MADPNTPEYEAGIGDDAQADPQPLEQKNTEDVFGEGAEAVGHAAQICAQGGAEPRRGDQAQAQDDVGAKADRDQANIHGAPRQANAAPTGCRPKSVDVEQHGIGKALT